MGNHENEKKRDVELIVNGKSFEPIPFPEGISLNGLLAQALEKTNNIGQPPENWIMRDIKGIELDLNKHLRDYEGLTQILLIPKFGIGG